MKGNVKIERGSGPRFADDAEAPSSKRFDRKIEEYIKHLENFELKCSRTPADHAKLLAEITSLNDAILRACAEFEEVVNFNKPLIEAAQARFRTKTDPILSKSHFINYARTWPRGFPGDYNILEYAYCNSPMSKGIGLYLDEYCLSTTLSKAVRERKETLRDILRAELEGRKKPKILDVACGSCREIAELASPILKSGAAILCIDSDRDALEFSAQLLAPTSLIPQRVEFRHYNALKMISHERNLKEFGMQDIIYSVGLFDYLQEDLVVRLLGSFYKLLLPNGRLIASFKDSRTYKTQFYHWMVDWSSFCQRTEEDCRKSFEKAGIPPQAITFTRDRSGVVMFFIATR